MPKTSIKASKNGMGLLSAFAIGLGMELLSGKLDGLEHTPAYQQLLEIFAQHHKNFNPITWKNLKLWLAFYNNSKDLEFIFAPVLFRLNQRYHIENKKKYQAYALEDMAKMAFALQLHLVESKMQSSWSPKPDSLFLNQSLSPVVRKPKAIIYLKNEESSWEVLVDEDDIDLINRSSRKLKIPLSQAFQNKIDIAAPEAEQIKTIDAPGAMIRERIIDNPRGGDCAFYAFVIALINIIKNEGTYKNKSMFNQWVTLDSSIKGLYNLIFSFDFDRPNNRLLAQLQRSLRKISHQTELDELKRACASSSNNYLSLVGNSTYSKFAEFYYNPNSTDGRFNEFANSESMLEEVLAIDKSQVVENFEHLILVPKFLSLIYGDNVDPKSITAETPPSDKSPVIKGMKVVLQDAFWGTHLNLDYLATAFAVNFHPLKNLVAYQSFVDINGRHTVTINNEDEIHWTTAVTYAKELRPLLSSNRSFIKEFAKKLLTLVAKILGISRSSSDEKKPVKEEASKEKPLIHKGNIEERDTNLRGSHIGTISLTKEPLEIEINKEKKRLEKNAKILKLGDDEAREKLIDSSELEKQQHQLEFLKGAVTTAVVSYVNYSENIWFSLFHRHGQAGRVRARNFLTQFLRIDDLNEAQKTIINFLFNNKHNGNTYPHSFRTMLLHSLQADPKPTLNYISKHFDDMLNELAKALGFSKDSKNHVVDRLW